MDVSIVVEVASATVGDSDTYVRQEPRIEGNRFQVLAWFNTTSNVIAAETCNRSPHVVTVKLMKGDQVLDRLTLTVEKDFRRTRRGDYLLRNPITLHHELVATTPAR